MRKVYLIALSVSAIALAGCESSDSTDSASLDLCGIDCPDGGGGGGGGGGSGGTGASISSGDSAIVLEKSKMVSPASGGLAALASKIDPTKPLPDKVTLQVNQKAASDGASFYSDAITMDNYPPGSAVNGLGANEYKEYRQVKAGRDDELQVWRWDNSYAAQYRDASQGGEAAHQAWFFGGNKTATSSMPTSASATYAGEWGGTAKASNWVQQPSDPQDPNGLYMVHGTTNLTADFTNKTLTGSLTPTQWQKFDSNANLITYAPPASEDIGINTKITGNTFSGTAQYGTFAVSGDNPVNGAFFGAGAAEATGAFNVHAVYPNPFGGNHTINDDRRGFMDISGIFHGTRQ